MVPLAASGQEPASPPTPAERADFRATPSLEETLAFLDSLAPRLPEMHRTTFGTSLQGRPMPLVILSKERAFTPEAARRVTAETGKPVVMIQNGIHSGEIDGKDACLMILRDLAAGRLPEVLDAATLLIVPVYNVDGHERVSPYNRANQNGPEEGMGFRTTATGHDLNRDHLKVETPEARALIRLVSEWRPHLHVDDHVTNGSDHDWVLTWSWAEAPQLAAPVDAWMKRAMPRVLEATEAAGHRTGPYVSLLDRADPSKGFDSWVGSPRYSSGYFPLRHRPSILVEMHSYKPYRQRVLANRDFLVALLREIADSGPELVQAVEGAEARTVARGRSDAEASEMVVAWEADPEADTIRWPVYEWSMIDSVALGVPILDYETGVIAGDDPAGLEVPWIHRPRPALTAERPRGYLVLPGWPVIEERLAVHGLEVRRLGEETEVEVISQRLAPAGAGTEFAAAPYQGRHQVTVERVEETVERRSFPEGTLWIPADQPDFEVAVQLLEPRAPDSLVAWGMLSTLFERKEYIEPRVLEPLVRELLEIPELRAEWEEALEDEAFASNPGARWMWWYRRTPYWDDSVGLLPAFRVVGEVPGG